MKVNFSLVVLSMAFAVCCTTYNFIDVKPIDIYGIQLTAGLALVAFSYVVSDCITELYGWKIMMKVVLTTVSLHLLTVGAIQLACVLPPNANWELNDEFVAVIGQSPKVALLSALAFLSGTSTNAFVMDKLKKLWSGKYFKWRAFLSTVAGEFVDCVAFLPFMFAGVLPAIDIINMIILYTVYKCACEVAVLPITATVIKRLRNYD